MEIRFSVADDFMNDMKDETGLKPTQLTTEALSLLKWAIGQAREGRGLYSADEGGGNIQRVVMPSLQKAMERRPVLEAQP